MGKMLDFINPFFCPRTKFTWLMPLVIGVLWLSAKSTNAQTRKSFEAELPRLVQNEIPASDKKYDEFYERHRPLPDDAFQITRELLRAANAKGAVAGILSISKAILVFTEKDSLYRAHLSDILIQGALEDRTLEKRLFLQALITYSNLDRNKPIDIAVFQALYKHAAYKEPSEDDRLPNVGGEIRKIIDKEFASYSKSAANYFIPAFSFMIKNEIETSAHDDSKIQKEVFIWRKNKFENALRFLHNSISDSLGITWKDKYKDRELLEILQSSFLDLLKTKANTAIDIRLSLQKHYSYCASLWTDELRKWNWAMPDGEKSSKETAYENEKRLKEVINKNSFAGQEAVNTQLKMVELCGGWFKQSLNTNTIAEPKPSWIRNWSEAAKSSNFNHPLSIPLEAFIRLSERLTAPDTGFTQYMNRDYLNSLARRLNLLADSLGLLPRIRLDGEARAASVRPSVNNNNFFVQDSTSQESFKNAIRTVLAGYYIWRGEIEYRELGPKEFEKSFAPDSINVIRQFYAAGKDLLEQVTNTAPEGYPFSGLGLFGRMLELERAKYRGECNLRLQQLEAGFDFAGGNWEWPGVYVGDIFNGVKASLAYLDVLDKKFVHVYDKKILDAEIEKSRLIFENKRLLAEAEAFSLQADSSELRILYLEKDKIDSTITLGEIQKREKEYLLQAAEYATLARSDENQASGALEKLKKFELEIIRQQIAQLTANIEQLDKQTKDIPKTIENANKEFKEFVEKTEQEFERKEHERQEDERREQKKARLKSLGLIIGNAIGMYYTGLPLASIADNMYTAVDQKDYFEAARIGLQAADKITDGQISTALEKYKLKIEDIDLFNKEKFPAVIQDISKQYGIPVTEAQSAVLASAVRNTLKGGLSVLAENTYLGKMANKIGLKVPEVRKDQIMGALKEIANDAGELAADAFYQALKQQTDKKVVAAILDSLGLSGIAMEVKSKGKEYSETLKTYEEQIKKKIGALGGEAKEYETEISLLLAKLKAHIPEVDSLVLATKREFGNAKQEFAKKIKDKIDKISQKTNLTVVDVELALADLEKERLANIGPIRVPLPTPIREKIRSFIKHVNEAKSTLSFWSSPEKIENLANQISSLDPRQFQREFNSVKKELSGQINEATTYFVKAIEELDDLQKILTKFENEDSITAYQNLEIAKWQADAAGKWLESEKQLKLAAAQAYEYSAMQNQINKVSLKIVNEKINQQGIRIDSQKHKWQAAQKEQQASEIEMQIAKFNQEKWEVVYGSEDRKTIQKASDISLKLRDYINTQLIQAWRLMAFYQVDYAKLAEKQRLIFVRPSFSIKTYNELQTGFETLNLTLKIWNSIYPEQKGVFSTIKVTNLSGDLEEANLVTIGPEDVYEGIDTLKFRGERELDSLKHGVRFQILPNALPDTFIDKQDSFPATIVLTTKVPDSLQIRFLDTFSERIRILGFKIEKNDKMKGGPFSFILYSEADSWVKINKGKKKFGFKMDIPELRDGEQIGKVMRVNEFVKTGLNTRPLFGTYQIRIDDESYQAIKDDLRRKRIKPEDVTFNFHFVAVGRKTRQ